MTESRVLFGPGGRFELRSSSRELLADGVPLRLGARAFELLHCLLEHRGEAVPRDRLFERAWPGRVVADDNLKVQVMALRKLLGSDAVVTVPGVGYRLGPSAAVETAADEAVPEASGLVGGVALVGRDAELNQLLALLSASRLVTLLGPGGVGKTRLAIAAATAAAPRADGVAVVELAPLADPRELPASVWRALRLPGSGNVSTGSLAATLRPLQLLLVLDNCEHLRSAVASLVEALLDAAPRLTLLATSQEPLGIAHEVPLRIGGLACPRTDQPERIQRAIEPAVALFAARARAADPRFVIDGGNAAAVGEICRRLDGLPLALELAAARVPLLGVEGVASRLGQQLQLLARGLPEMPLRHQTLRAAMQWSHALLDDAERAAFRRLGVFAGSFSLAAANAVIAGSDARAGDSVVDLAAAADDWRGIELLTTLVDKSLVQLVHGGAERRFRLLESARAFALERLAESGEATPVRRRHALGVLARLEAAEATFHGAPLKSWVDSLLPDLDNLRAALRFASGPGGDTGLALALAGAAGSFWAAAGLDDEAGHWLDVVGPLLDDRTPPLHAARYWQARALRLINPVAAVADGLGAAREAAVRLLALGDTSGAYRMLGLVVQHLRRVEPGADVQALLEQMRQLEPPHWSARQRLARSVAQARLAARAGDWEQHRERFRIDAALEAEAGDEMRAWGGLYHVALADIALGRPREAIATLEPVVARIRELGLIRQQWTRPALLTMARIASGAGPAAAAAVRETVTLLRVAGAPSWLADHFAWWAAQCAAFDDAARLLGWADSAAATRGEPRRLHHSQQGADGALALLLPALDASRLDQLRAEGRTMPDEVALQRVLQVAA